MTLTSGLLLDTDVVAELRRPDPHPAVTDFLFRRRHFRIFISALTIGELHAASHHFQGIGTWLSEFEERYSHTILPVDAAVAGVWGRLPNDTDIPSIDSLIAATAIHKRLAVVSGNADGYRRLSVPILNPWISGSSHDPADPVPPLNRTHRTTADEGAS